MTATPDMTPVPVEHPYIDRDPVVRIRPGQRVILTLLVDPRGAVHVTSGIVPRKKIELMREHVAPALDAMALTFRSCPCWWIPIQSGCRFQPRSEVGGARCER